MPSLSPLEIVVVGVLALIVFGPQRLPEIARNIGKAINEFRRQATDIRAEFEEGFSVDDEQGLSPELSSEDVDTAEVNPDADAPGTEAPPPAGAR